MTGGLLKMAGVRGINENDEPQFVIAKEREATIVIVRHTRDINLTPEEARAFADQIYELASRVEDRNK